MEKTAIASNKKSTIIAKVTTMAAASNLVGKEDENFLLVDDQTERRLLNEVIDGRHGDLAKKMREEGMFRQYFQRIAGFRTLWGLHTELSFRAIEPKNSVINQVRSKMYEKKLSNSTAVVHLDKATEEKMFAELRSGMYGDEVKNRARIVDKLSDVLYVVVGWNLRLDAPKFDVMPL